MALNDKHRCILDEVEWMGGHDAVLAKKTELKRVLREADTPYKHQDVIRELESIRRLLRVSRKYGGHSSEVSARHDRKHRDTSKPSRAQRLVIESLKMRHLTAGRSTTCFNWKMIGDSGLLSITSNSERLAGSSSIHVIVGPKGGVKGGRISRMYTDAIELKGRCGAMWWVHQYID